MGLRCKPDQLCRIVRSEAGNVGRWVSTRRLVTSADGLPLGTGNRWLLNRDAGPLWLCSPLQPLRAVNRFFFGVKFEMGPVIFPDAWLEPVPGEPEATSDRIDISAGVAHA